MRERNAELVSIHAPGRERMSGRAPYVFPLEFQSTLPRGSEQPFVAQSNHMAKFQSTLPRGSERVFLPGDVLR